MLRSVSIPSSSATILRGVLHLPSDKNCCFDKMAILLPGLIGTRVGPHRILFDLAELFAAKGIPALRCDLTGGGYSDGDPSTLTFKDLVQDTHILIDYCRSHLKAKRFTLGGICRGARVALAAAVSTPCIEDLVLLSCARFQEDSLWSKASRRRSHHLRKYLHKFAALKWIPRLIKGDLNFGLICKALASPIDNKTLERLNVLGDGIHDLEAFKTRTLFIYGTEDPDQADSIAYYQASLCSQALGKVSIERIAGADAGFYAAHWHREVLEKVSFWLEGSARE